LNALRGVLATGERQPPEGGCFSVAQALGCECGKEKKQSPPAAAMSAAGARCGLAEALLERAVISVRARGCVCA
jgi:hypothetical protein